jgi:hypothetical protein
MTKKQKIWLWVFIGMFILLELLYGAIIKIFNLSILPIYKDPQLFYDNPSVALLILLIELIVTIGLIYLINKIKFSKLYKIITNIFLVIISLFLFAGLILGYTLSHISFP